jgi:hypothetical protein
MNGSIRRLLAPAAAFAGSATMAFSSLAAAQTTPPMGGGYTNVVPISVDDPSMKAIAGALLKPTGGLWSAPLG